jgi:hypothetical protein
LILQTSLKHMIEHQLLIYIKICLKHVLEQIFFEHNSTRQTTSGKVKSEANRCFQSGETKQSFSAEIQIFSCRQIIHFGASQFRQTATIPPPPPPSHFETNF